MIAHHIEIEGLASCSLLLIARSPGVPSATVRSYRIPSFGSVGTEQSGTVKVLVPRRESQGSAPDATRRG